jgi:hypothetical protein
MCTAFLTAHCFQVGPDLPSLQKNGSISSYAFLMYAFTRATHEPLIHMTNTRELFATRRPVLRSNPKKALQAARFSGAIINGGAATAVLAYLGAHNPFFLVASLSLAMSLG